MSEQEIKKVTTEALKSKLREWTRDLFSFEEIKSIIRELEKEQIPGRKNGRPLGVGNKQSQLMAHHARIKKELDDRIFRGDIAEGLGVSRQTLNEFIRVNLPEYHKPK